jgi:hypothetical protein
VALNHPQRWLQRAVVGGDADVKFNCPIGFTSAYDEPCTPTGQAPTPANVARALFYQMKGLFVTPGTTTEGPATDQAVQGDKVTLRARVYNYSLKNMPPGTKVRVHFYAQPWSVADGQFLPGNAAGFAPAEFIGEDILNPIPAFCGGAPENGPNIDPCSFNSAPRNWAFAQATWDTSTVAAKTNWKFWVVAWMEDSNGQKVAEIQDHGLKAIPNSSPDHPLPSLAEVPIETYSNNLGYYNQVFYVGPPAGALQAPVGSRRLDLDTQWEQLPKGVALQADQVLTIGASHRAVGADLDNVMVLFYDGDPEQGGKLFDMERIPHIDANENFVTRVPYHTGVCGAHQLFVRAIPMDDEAPMTADVNAVTVACPAPSFSITKFQGKAEHVGSRANNGKLQVSGTVIGVSGLDLSTTTLRLLDLVRESAGAGELVRDSFGPLLPLPLTARPGSNGKSAIFETPASTITPQVRVELKQANPNKDELDFSARIERVVIKAPQGCGASAKGTVQLQTRFSLASQAREPVDITTQQPWQCKGDQLKTP